MKVKGIKRGQIIELLEEIAIPDGSEIAIEISKVHPLSQLNKQERVERIDAVLGAWKDDPEIAAIFTEIDQERHAYEGRQSASFDD